MYQTSDEEEATMESMDQTSDEEEERTFVQVISEKYISENFPLCRRTGMGVVVLPSPPGSPTKDHLHLPSVLVLNYCGISKAGNGSEVASYCAHVIELDLSYNQLKDWGEVGTIVSNIPRLNFLNLSMNPLSGCELEPRLAQVFSRVRRLVLIKTHISWDTVHTLTQHSSQLEELFLCLNDYHSVTESPVPCPSLRLLQITDNRLQDWAEVRKFGAMYPGLEVLVLANNSLRSVEETGDALQSLFPNLRSINLNSSGLGRWEDIERLNLFPKLREVKAQGLPLLQAYSRQERRSLVVAQLPSVTVLNGSVVSDGEREDAERFFIRHFCECPEEELPQRYRILVSKYGELPPLAEVDLSPRSALVDVRWGDTVETLSLRLELTVQELKKQLRSLVGVPASAMRLFYMDRVMCCVTGPEEMRLGCRALHSYGMQDGDEIHVVPRAKNRCSSSESS